MLAIFVLEDLQALMCIVARVIDAANSCLKAMAAYQSNIAAAHITAPYQIRARQNQVYTINRGNSENIQSNC